MSEEQRPTQEGNDEVQAGRWPLPPRWVWTNLGEILENFDGRRVPVKAKDREKRPGQYPYYGASGIIDNIDAYLFDGDFLLIAEDGANLLSRSTPIAFRAFGKFWVNNHAHVVRPRGGMPLSYVEWYLNGTNIQFYVTGTAQPKLNQVNLNKISCPLPPLQEQRRIVAKIEELFSKLDAGVAALERVRAALKRYRAAVLKAAVEGRLTQEWRAKHPATEPAPAMLQRILHDRRCRWEKDQLARFAAAGREPPKGWQTKYVKPTGPDVAGLLTLPEAWCWVTVEQLIVFLRNGLSQKPAPLPPGPPILRINAVRPMRVDLKEVRYLNPPPNDLDGYQIENNDLLFTRYNGSVDLLGVAGLVRGCTQPTLHPDKLIRVKTALGHPLPSFLEVASNVGVSRKHMASRARTTAGQTGISGQDIREMPVPLPPLAEQEQIIAEIEERLSVVDKVEAQVEVNLKRAARLRQSILKRAFEGRLVPQDPADEPADLLLARIRSDKRQAGAPRQGRKA